MSKSIDHAAAAQGGISEMLNIVKTHLIDLVDAAA